MNNRVGRNILLLVLVLLALVGLASDAFAMRTHIVVKGDTLCELSIKEYESKRCVPELVELIGDSSYVVNYDTIFIGQILIIPEHGETGLPNREAVAAFNKEKWIARLIAKPSLYNNVRQRPVVPVQEIVKLPLKLSDFVPDKKMVYHSFPAPSRMTDLDVIKFVKVVDVKNTIPNFVPSVPPVQYQAPIPPVQLPDPSKYAPHIHWTNIINGIEEHPEEQSKKKKK